MDFLFPCVAAGEFVHSNMYIKKVKKKNKYSPKVFEYCYLVESIRTEKGPRQRFLLNLGKLNLPVEEWPLLARRIEEIVRGQENFIGSSPEIESLAVEHAQTLIRKFEKKYEEPTVKNFTSVNLETIETERFRSIGAEHVGLIFFNRLEFSQCLKDCGFTDREIEVAALLIIGRLVNPASESGTHKWAKELSGLGELMGADFTKLSLNTLYKVDDKLIENKEIIERHLQLKERSLFALKEQILLYDLTNTFFEGSAKSNSKAKFGRSKEKRSDCRLVTLGLVIDSDGFPKTSKVFEGNIHEAATLLEMIKKLQRQSETADPTVVIDAGIATDDNLKLLRQHNIHYICVSRKKVELPDDDELLVIRQDKNNTVKAKAIKKGDETFIYCQSLLKAKKEQSIQSRFEQNFEEGLKAIKVSLSKKGGTKNYQKVCERLGRLKEKYSRIAQYYDITIEQKKSKATEIKWSYNKKEQSDRNHNGSYFLRTDRQDLGAKKIWQIYVMLTDLEAAFRSLKSEMGLRPIFHQKEERCDSHLFITVLAYHLLQCARTRLKQVDINYSWAMIRKLLASHGRVTVALESEIGEMHRVRLCTKPDNFQRRIYSALGIAQIPRGPTHAVS